MGCIALVRCVLVLRCGLAGVVWYPDAGWIFNNTKIRKYYIFKKRRVLGIYSALYNGFLATFQRNALPQRPRSLNLAHVDADPPEPISPTLKVEAAR